MLNGSKPLVSVPPKPLFTSPNVASDEEDGGLSLSASQDRVTMNAPEWTPDAQLDSRHCHFPSTATAVDSADAYSTISVISQVAGSAAEHGRAKCCSEILQPAWAVLLYNYIRETKVAFAVIMDTQKADHSLRAEEPKVHVLEYDFSENFPLRAIETSACYKTSIQNLTAYGLNTALLYSEDKSVSAWEENKANPTSTPFHLDMSPTSVSTRPHRLAKPSLTAAPVARFDPVLETRALP